MFPEPKLKVSIESREMARMQFVRCEGGNHVVESKSPIPVEEWKVVFSDSELGWDSRWITVFYKGKRHFGMYRYHHPREKTSRLVWDLASCGFRWKREAYDHYRIFQAELLVQSGSISREIATSMLELRRKFLPLSRALNYTQLSDFARHHDVMDEGENLKLVHTIECCKENGKCVCLYTMMPEGEYFSQFFAYSWTGLHQTSRMWYVRKDGELSLLPPMTVKERWDPDFANYNHRYFEKLRGLEEDAGAWEAGA